MITVVTGSPRVRRRQCGQHNTNLLKVADASVANQYAINIDRKTALKAQTMDAVVVKI